MAYEIEDAIMDECPHEEVCCFGIVMCADCGFVFRDRVCDELCANRPMMTGSSNRTLYADAIWE
jgi:hypothetical protein